MDKEYPKVYLDPQYSLNLSLPKCVNTVVIQPDGDIYVNGVKTDDEKEIVKALREIVKKNSEMSQE